MNQELRFSEVFDELRNIIYGAWRYRWKGVALIWLLCIPGWIWVMALPDVFEASSRVFMDTTSTLSKIINDEIVRIDADAEAKIMVRSLTSRPNLQLIASRTGLIVGDESTNEVEGIIRKLQDELDIVLDSSKVLQVTYQNADPELALAVTSQFIDAFIEGLMGVNRADTDDAQKFLREQIKNYEARLEKAEARLADFKKENIGLMPNERGDYFSRLQQAEEELNSLTFDIRLARERQAELSRQLEGETPIIGTPFVDDELGSVESTTDRQIQKYEEELVLLRMRYTDSHPDIVRILSILEDFRRQQAEEQSGLAGSQDPSLQTSQFYQTMRMQLASVELKLIELESKRAEQMKLVADLRGKIDIIPDIEANLTRLNRDYEVNKAQYDGLLRQLETAKMTEAAEDSKTQFDFRIIDPPAVTASPVGPNRVLFMTAVLIVSIASGIALAVFLSFTRPVFFTARALEQRFGIPVLGGIRFVESRTTVASARRNLIFLTACFTAVFCAYGLVISFDQVGAQLVRQLAIVLGSMT